MPTFSSQGLTLHYREIGEGAPLVLIHGWGATGAEWQDAGWVESLPGRRLLIPDVRGHGQSAALPDPNAYEMMLLAGDVIALLEAERLSEADVFGYSMGGSIALWTAVLAPFSVRALIAGAVSGSDPEAARAMGRQIAGEEPMTPRAEIYRAYALRCGATDLAPLAACLQAGLAPPPCAELAVFGGEALMAAGDLDRRHDLTRDLAGCLPGGRFVTIAGADHMGAFEDPRLIAEVQGFLAETSPA